ncbi:Cutinase [Rhodococcus erythropolis]|uniref:cutinase family protein n=1 Tax=Rhodococcus erythropolis TaxID=1833 RepID=UPI001555C947|nr:cutinase family protein [Rhodococcus erythropolis]PBI95373.1 Cutinase [Rhodococcus erythropolis]
MRTTSDTHESPKSKKGIKRALCVVASLGVVVGGLVVTAPVASANSCSPLIAIGAPGTNQGAQHGGGAAGMDSILGEQVTASVGAFVEQEPWARLHGVSYPATGVDGVGAAIAKLAYNASVYKKSKDTGYSVAYAAIQTYAAECPGSRFVLFGYSQGAHIMGDIAQSAFGGNGPVARSRIAGVVLIADPAYNGGSPGSVEFIYDKKILSRDDDHWEIGGALGIRAPFGKDDPVISICIYGDPICDGASVGMGGLNAKSASDKAWMHTTLYTGNPFGGNDSLAAWAGIAIAGRAKG